RQLAAEQLIGQVVQHKYAFAPTGYFIGQELGNMGFPAQALSILTPLESTYKDSTDYWETIFTLASSSGMGEPLFDAAENLYRMDPDNWAYTNNYAALLVSERRKPETAVSLTYELMNRDKNVNIASVINHALALALNRRFVEAVEYMKKNTK
ncbi:hypothetical protein OAM21_02225, partial [Verrucomicrobia bacterium]|nr:hypothetical protein [Verrucomicrobiota bacterium]